MNTAAYHSLTDIFFLSEYQSFSGGECGHFTFQNCLSQSAPTRIKRPSSISLILPSLLSSLEMTDVLVPLWPSNEVTDDPSKFARSFQGWGLIDLPLRALSQSPNDMFKGSLVDPRLRASNEHTPFMRVPRAGGRPGCPAPSPFIIPQYDTVEAHGARR